MGDLILAKKTGALTGTKVSSSVWRFVRCRMKFLFQTGKADPQRCKWLAKRYYLLPERDLNFRSLKSQRRSLTRLLVAVFVLISALLNTLYLPDVKWNSSWYLRNYGPGCKKPVSCTVVLWLFLTKNTWEYMLERESVNPFGCFSSFLFLTVDLTVGESGDLDIVTILKLIRLEGCSVVCSGRREWHEGGKRREQGAVSWIRAFVNFQKRRNSDV